MRVRYTLHAVIVDVSTWLKSLRLHKYSPLFQQMSYDEMLNLTDDWLESRVSHLWALNNNTVAICIRDVKPESSKFSERMASYQIYCMSRQHDSGNADGGVWPLRQLSGGIWMRPWFRQHAAVYPHCTAVTRRFLAIPT